MLTRKSQLFIDNDLVVRNILSAKAKLNAFSSVWCPSCALVSGTLVNIHIIHVSDSNKN